MTPEAKLSLGPSIGSKDRQSLSVWIVVPSPDDADSEPYSDSLRVGFFRGLTDHSFDPEMLTEACIRVDTIYTSSLHESTRHDRIISNSVLKELNTELRPNLCVGEIRSDVAAELVRFCERHQIIFLGTDHAATRLHKAASEWYFRISPTCDQMIGEALNYMLRNAQEDETSVYRGVRRIALVFPNYEYGHAFAADCQRWVTTPRQGRRFGLTHAVEVETAFSNPPQPPTDTTRRMCWRRIAQCHPEAIMLGLWGSELTELLEWRPVNDPALKVPLIIPDAGWDRPCEKVAFPLGSIVGARYYFPTECWTTRYGLPGITGNLWDRQWLASIGETNRWTTGSLRYQIGAAYEAGRLVAGLFQHVGDGRAMTQMGKHTWRNEARQHLRGVNVRSFGYDDMAARNPERTTPTRTFVPKTDVSHLAIRPEVREYRIEHAPPLRVCVTEGASMKDTDKWAWTV